MEFIKSALAVIFALVLGFASIAFAAMMMVGIPVAIIALAFVVARFTWHLIVR